jgi:hypothetical protein
LFQLVHSIIYELLQEWKTMCEKVDKMLEQGHVSAQKMTLHEDQDKELADMRARYVQKRRV